MKGIRNQYLDTEFGQLHARRQGSGEPVVLLHLTPGSGAQFDHVLPELAERGYQVWALDVLGNGRSAPLPHGYTFEIAARALGQAIDDAGLTHIKLVGGHMTAQMAVELVVTRPELATHLVIDGLPMWDREKREEILGFFNNGAPNPSEDGSHILEAWNRALHLHKAWNINLTLEGAGHRRLTRALIDSLEQGLDMELGVNAFRNYDVQGRLKDVGLPTLVTTATGDTLHDQHAATVAAIANAKGHQFAGTHPRHIDARATEYVDVLSGFFTSSDTPS